MPPRIPEHLEPLKLLLEYLFFRYHLALKNDTETPASPWTIK